MLCQKEGNFQKMMKKSQKDKGDSFKQDPMTQIWENSNIKVNNENIGLQLIK